MPKIFHEWTKQWIRIHRLSVLVRSVRQSPRFIHFIHRTVRAQDRAVSYATFFSRSHDVRIRVYYVAGTAVETHEHSGDFKVP